jgi:hypothetical protein
MPADDPKTGVADKGKYRCSRHSCAIVRYGFAEGRHRIVSRGDLLTTADAGGAGRGLPAI